MNHLIWKLHYRQVYWALGALCALVAVLIVTGINMSNDYHSFEATCAASSSCGEAGNLLFRGDGFVIDLVNSTLVIAALFGMFWGAPLVGKEYEDGTQNLAWTQGVTRKKWFGVNMAWVITAAVVWTVALTALVTWWRSPENAISGRFGAFDLQGVVPIAYSIFAVCLGVAAGTILRRSVPAIAATIGGFLLVRFVIGVWARPYFMPAITKAYGLGAETTVPSGAWVISQRLIGPNGASLRNMLELCGGKSGLSSCLAAHGYHQLVTYQPADRFWSFQWTEAGIFVAMAAALVVVAYTLVLKRDA